MKITSNYAYKPNFGYDKELNSQLIRRLKNYSATTDNNWAATLTLLNCECNSIEGLLRKEELKQNNHSRMEDYKDIFYTSKQLLADYVSMTFEQLNFADREFNHYYDEFVKSGSKKDDWRITACNALKDWLSPNLITKLNSMQGTKDELYTPDFDENGDEIEETQNKQQLQLSPKVQNIINQIKPQLKSGSFLEEYIPTDSSPRGFSDVAGMEELKRDLSEGVIQLIQDPEQAKLDLEEYGKEIPKGLLLYGPPGCGKTYITQALSQEIKTPLYLLNISKSGSHYINMTSKNIAEAFDEAISIADKTGNPCLVFMDEIDTMCFDRNSRMEPEDLKQVGTILQSIDKAKNHNVIIIGATNKYNLLDPAVKRRFDSKVFVGLPDTDAISALLKKNLSSMKKGEKLLSNEEELQKIAKMLNGYSNSSICAISKEAALFALRRNRADISVEDYENAIKKTGEEKPDSKEYLSDSKKESKKIGFYA